MSKTVKVLLMLGVVRFAICQSVPGTSAIVQIAKTRSALKEADAYIASQTAKATEEIARQIMQIQTATQEAVSAIRGIATTIEKVSEISATIAAAVEQQGSATAEIAMPRSSLAATITRLKMSRPSASVPNQCAALGGISLTAALVISGS